MEEQKKIYIGNLDYAATESDIGRLLEEQGITAGQINIISDRDTGRSKGFGFAEFETEEAAQKAIEALDGKDLNGRTLKVNKAKKMQPRRDSFGGGGGGGGFRSNNRY